MLMRSTDLFFGHLNQEVAATISQALAAIDEFDTDKFWELLEPLISNQDAAALFYAAMVGYPGETLAGFEKRHIEQLQASAKLGYVPAIHELAIRYDAGDTVAQDTRKAAQLFKLAAQQNHPHSQWIHGEDLLYGRNGIEKDEQLGIQYIKKSAEAKFEGALETLAMFYEQGIFGFQKNIEKSKAIRQQIARGDIISY